MRIEDDLQHRGSDEKSTPSRPEQRRLLEQHLTTSNDFDAFCCDYFPAVYERFTSGMDRVSRTTLLFQLVNAENLSQALRSIVEDNPLGTIDWVPHGLPGDATVEEFLEIYRTELRGGASFAGRDHELAALDNWRNATSGPAYLLLIAPPGLGKSSLLVRWWERLIGHEAAGQRTVFCPISLRLGMDREDDYLTRMTAALAPLQGRRQPEAQASMDSRRQALRELLRRPLPDGQKLLFIVDGLDEAVDLNLSPGPFPQRLGHGIKVLISMREGTDEASIDGWRRRLGLERSELATTMRLELLSRGEVAALVSRTASCDPLVRVELVDELYRLAQGDPLVLRLYLEHMREVHAEGRLLSVETLRQLSPGLEGVFAQWWDVQRRIWGSAKPYAEPLSRELLNLLACARAPLARHDLESLLPAANMPDGFALADALRPLSRWIIGDGERRGYAFSHLRLADFFRARMRQDECRLMTLRLATYCQDAASGLGKCEQSSEAVSEYALRCYGVHLEDQGADAQAFAPLVSEPWRRLWFSRTGDFLGFAADVNRAWRATERCDRARTHRGDSPAGLETSLRCALYKASINTTLLRVPAALICAAVKRGCWTLAKACDYARSSANPEDRAQALFELAQGKKSASAFDEQLLLEALTSARQISNRGERAAMLTEIFAAMPDTLQALRDQVVRAEVEALQSNDELVAHALISYLPFLSDEEKSVAATEIQQRFGEFLRQEDRLYAAAETAAKLPPELAAHWEMELLREVKGIPFYHCQLHFFLPSLSHENAQHEAYILAQQTEHPAMRADALSRLATSPQFPERLRLAAFCESIAALADYFKAPELHPEPMQRTDESELDALPGWLRDGIGTSTTHVAKILAQIRAEKVLFNLSLWVPNPVLPEFIAVAQAACVNPPSIHHVAHAARLRALARMPTPHWDDIFSALERIPPTERRGALVALADWLPTDQVFKALSLCTEISDFSAKVRALTALATQPLSDELLSGVVECLAASQEPFDSLLTLLKAVPAAARKIVRPSAFCTAKKLPRGVNRIRRLINLLPLLEDEKDETAASAACELLDFVAEMQPTDLAHVICDLLPHLASTHAAFPRLVDAALDAIKRDFKGWGFTSHLKDLCLYFSAEQRSELRQHVQCAAPEVRALILACLMSSAPEQREGRTAIATEALLAIEKIPTHKLLDRMGAFQVLAPHLPEDLFRRARRLALRLHTLDSTDSRGLSLVVTALLALHAHAPQRDRLSLLHDALRVIKEQEKGERYDVKDLIRLIPHLPDDRERTALVERAMQAFIQPISIVRNSLDATNDRYLLASQLKELAPLLTQSQRKRLFDSILNQEDVSMIEALKELIPYLAHEDLSRLYATMSQLGSFRRRKLWRDFTATQVSEPLAVRYSLFCEILRDISIDSRDDMLHSMDVLDLLLGGMGAPACANAVTRAVLDVCDAWR